MTEWVVAKCLVTQLQVPFLFTANYDIPRDAIDLLPHVSQRVYTVYTFRDGKIARYQEFYEERDALQAAGLRE